jgi:cholesterol transport system auxiliary component
MKTLIIPLVAVLLGGCASATRQPIETYDFGVSASSPPPAGQDVFLTEVGSAEWLSTTDMLYRLEYRDPRVLAPYSASRWAGTPAGMLAVRLRQSVGTGLSARRERAKCTLGLFITEFSQVFSSEHSSSAVMHIRATLTDTTTAERARVREFRIERPTPTANAAGAAAAFSDIAALLAGELNSWIAESGTCKD